jgi:alkaline phosphatase
MLLQTTAVCVLLSGGLAQGESIPTTPRDTLDPRRGNVIFVHPDGAGVAQWTAARLLMTGPDGVIAWDRLPHVGVYRGHLQNSLGSSSHGAATAHAYGRKVPYDSYGMFGDQPLESLSGKPFSLLIEAREAGMATALLNSGHLAEPGTGVFAASAPARADVESITSQLVESGVDYLLAGGEVLLLPQDERGHFGYRGLRTDGRNLIDRARELGYAVVYSRAELFALPDTTPKVLGIFAPGHTFHDQPEESLRAMDLPLYLPSAPSVGEMTTKVLRMLHATGRQFMLVVEEEGSDNFANANNAAGTLEALARADGALSAAMAFLEDDPETLLLTAADSDAGGLEVWPVRGAAASDRPLPSTTDNGAPLDGSGGTGTKPFEAKPDAAGERLRFGIAWAGGADMLGGIVARAAGLNAELLPATVDNTDIYRLMYATLFEHWLP